MAELLDLRTEFDELFIAPYKSHRWASPEGRPHWLELEGWQDAIAGPLSSICKTGDCAYVYDREDGYFANVADPESLRRELLDLVKQLKQRVARFQPTTPQQTSDLDYMQDIVERMRNFTMRACVVEVARWMKQ